MIQDYYVDMMIAYTLRGIIAELSEKGTYKTDRDVIAAIMIALTCKDDIDLIMEKWRKILDDKTES